MAISETIGTDDIIRVLQQSRRRETVRNAIYEKARMTGRRNARIMKLTADQRKPGKVIKNTARIDN